MKIRWKSKWICSEIIFGPVDEKDPYQNIIMMLRVDDEVCQVVLEKIQIFIVDRNFGYIKIFLAYVSV
jgi:hypothetical protein